MAVRQYIGARYVPVFADEVQWNIDNTYDPLTMVQNSGETFMTRQYVPSGIELPDTGNGQESNDYWVHMSNWNAQVEGYRQEVLRYAQEVIAFDGRITANTEAIGDGFSSSYSIEDAIDDINDNINELDGDIDSETNARIFDVKKLHVYNTVSDMKSATDIAVGTICHTNGFRTVNDGGAGWYVISDSGTANEMDVIACGDYFATLLLVDTYVTPEMFGAYGDNVADDYNYLARCLSFGKLVKLGAKTYMTTRELKITNSIIGESGPRMGCTLGNGSVIRGNMGNAQSYVLTYDETGNDAIGYELANFAVDCDTKCSGILLKPSAARPAFKVNNVSIYNHAYIGISLDPVSDTSRFATLDNISITGNSDDAYCCIYVGAFAGDCSITNCNLMYTPKGIVIEGGGLRLDNMHIYGGKANIADIDEYFENTCGITGNSFFVGNNLYIDSFRVAVQQNSANAVIGTLFLYFDSAFNNAQGSLVDYQLKATASGTSIKVANLFQGGVRYRVGGLKTGNVSIRSLSQEYPEVSNFPPLMPILDADCGGDSYTYYQQPGENFNIYHRIARVYYLPAGSGNVVFNVNRTVLGSIIRVRRSNNVTTLENHTLPQAEGKVPLYYKEVEAQGARYIDFYTVPYGEVFVKSVCNTFNPNPNYSTFAINLNNCNAPHVSQSDTTGLTLVPQV